MHYKIFVSKPFELYDFCFVHFLVKIFRIFIFGNLICMHSHTNSRTRTIIITIIIIIHLWCVQSFCFVLFLFLLAHDDKCTAFGRIFKNPLLNIITALKKSVISAPLFAYYFRACKWQVCVCKVRACVCVFFFSFPLFHWLTVAFT